MVSLASSTCCSSFCAASCAESSSPGPSSGSAAFSCCVCSSVMSRGVPAGSPPQKETAARPGSDALGLGRDERLPHGARLGSPLVGLLVLDVLLVVHGLGVDRPDVVARPRDDVVHRAD